MGRRGRPGLAPPPPASERAEDEPPPAAEFHECPPHCPAAPLAAAAPSRDCLTAAAAATDRRPVAGQPSALAKSPRAGRGPGSAAPADGALDAAPGTRLLPRCVWAAPCTADGTAANGSGPFHSDCKATRRVPCSPIAGPREEPAVDLLLRARLSRLLRRTATPPPPPHSDSAEERILGRRSAPGSGIRGVEPHEPPRGAEPQSQRSAFADPSRGLPHGAIRTAAARPLRAPGWPGPGRGGRNAAPCSWRRRRMGCSGLKRQHAEQAM